jgi:hypothetical protein
VALGEGQIIQVIDTRTGEIVTETSNPNAGIYLGKRRKHPGGFVIVYENEFRDLTLILASKGAIPLALSNILMTKVEIGTGEILVNTVELAALLNTYRPQISKALRLLLDYGVISHVRKDGKHFVYKINPSIMWKGKESERQELLKVLQGGKKS